MLSVNAIYENGQVTLLEDLPVSGRARLIVTLVETLPPVGADAGAAGLLDDLTGVLDLREDGSLSHDRTLGECQS